MNTFARRTTATLLVSICIACNFPKAQDPSPAEENETDESAQARGFAEDHPFGSVKQTEDGSGETTARGDGDNMPKECQTNVGTVVAAALGGAYQGFKGLPNNSAEDDMARRCHLALENKRLELMKRGLELQAQALRLQVAKQQEQMLLEQLQSLCADGNAAACAAHDFAIKKAGCCSWHEGARSCTLDHHVTCFDGTASPTCKC